MAERASSVLSLVVVCFIFTFRLRVINANAEGNSLYAFKQKLSDPNNRLSDWDPQLVDPCSWSLITCDADNKVTRIDLQGTGISGPLAPDLGNLMNLKYLEMYNNGINGAIPSELAKLTNLVALDLSQNSLSGEIPPQLGDLKTLINVRLVGNKLQGHEPDGWANADASKYTIDLTGNPNLCGPHTDNKICP